jgi:hypothetical protein
MLRGQLGRMDGISRVLNRMLMVLSITMPPTCHLTCLDSPSTAMNIRGKRSRRRKSDSRQVGGDSSLGHCLEGPADKRAE